MSKQILIELVGENETGYCYADLYLPASAEEIAEAKERANWNSDSNGIRDISIEHCSTLPKLASFRLDSPTLDELNFLAQRLDAMDGGERTIMNGVLQYLCSEKGFADELVSMTDLINMTYGLDGVMIASNVGTDRQLGQFVIDNELNEDVNAIPETSLYLLDLERIGRLQRDVDGGVFVGNCYVVAGAFEMPHVYDGIHLPGAEPPACEQQGIRHISEQELRAMAGQEGLVLQGCGGDLKEWVDGINGLLTESGILRNGTVFTEAYAFSHDGLTNPPRSPICSPMRDISETAVIRKPTAARLCPSSNPRTVARKICTTPPAPTLPSWKKTCLRKSRCFSKKEKNNSPKPRHKISTLFRAAFDVPNAALSIAGKFAAEVSNGSVPGTKKTSRLVTRTTTAKNEGEAPMWLVENSHPAIVTREIFNKAQEESARRKAKAPVSQKSAMTASGKYSKYALTEVMICGECGSRYKRVTWNIRGKRRIVWRCISRLDYGKKYCTESITVDEQALQRAIVRALNRFNVEDEATYLLLMKSTIGEAVGINGSSDEIDLLERRIDALNKRMLDLVSLSVQEGDDAENHEDDFKNISTQIEQLTKRITAIRESESENGDFQARLKEIQDIIDKRRENKDIYDDSIVRQMVECIKVYHDGRLQIILGGGYELEEYLEK